MGRNFFLNKYRPQNFAHSLPTKFHADKLNALHGNLDNSNACYFGC